MDSPTYIQNAIRTESVPETININEVVLAGGLTIAALSATMLDHMKKKIFYGKPIIPQQLQAVCLQIAAGAQMLADACEDAPEMVNQPLPNETVVEIDSKDINLSNLNIRLLHSAIGCFTESGELLEAMMKQLAGHPLDLVNFGEEIGDIEWYQAIGFDETGVTEASCREKNIAKLRARYPEKFDAEKAENRDLEAERKTLEDEPRILPGGGLCNPDKGL